MWLQKHIVLQRVGIPLNKQKKPGLPFPEVDGFLLVVTPALSPGEQRLFWVSSEFVPIYLTMAVIGRQKLWFSLILSFMVGMFLFTMIPMLTPLDSTIVNVIGCLIGGALFSIGLGAVSNLILKKTSLV